MNSPINLSVATLLHIGAAASPATTNNAARPRDAREPCGAGDERAHAAIRGNRPRGRTASTARNARWPASTCQPGSTSAPKPLRDAKHDAANQRAPEIAQAPDDDGLEAEQQPPRPHERIKVGADAQEHPRQCDDGETQRHRGGVNAARVEAHQRRDLGVVAGGAKGAAERGGVKHPLQRENHADRRREGQQREIADGDAGQDLEAAPSPARPR